MAGPMTPEDIRTLRLGLGLTQQALAERLHVAASTVARWEAGRQSPNPAMTHALSELKAKLR